jgi:hypothetical protein
VNADEPGFELDAEPDGDRATPVARERPTRRRGGRRRPAKEAPDEARDDAPVGVLPWVLRPGLLILLGALLLAVAWIGYQNPHVNVNQEMPYWPWHLFRANLDQGGAPVFLWDRHRAVALGGAVLVVFLVVASLLRAGKGRSAAVLAAAGASAALFWRDIGQFQALPAFDLRGAVPILVWAGPVAAALLAGAVVGRDGLRGSRGSRWMLSGLLVVLAGTLFFPLAGSTAYDAPLLHVATPIRHLVDGTTAIGFDRLWSTDGIHAVGVVLLLLLGVVTLLGLRGPWTTPVATVLVLLTAAGPVVADALVGASRAEPATADLLQELAMPGWVALAACGVVLVAGLVSLLGLGGRWTMGVAGVALGLLALDVTCRVAFAGVETAHGLDPAFAAASRAALWLGPALGALLAPLGAALVDQHAG